MREDLHCLSIDSSSLILWRACALRWEQRLHSQNGCPSAFSAHLRDQSS